MDKETFYGNFAEPKEEKTSKRSEDVLLSAIDKIEQLTVEIQTLCRIIGEKEQEIARLTAENDVLQLRINLLKREK